MQQVTSHSADYTEALGAAIGERVKGGEVIELVSDLGGGKTVFVRGLARGMGSRDKVASPTFTISREYRGKRLTLYHFDFYRLTEADIVADELHEVAGDPDSVVAIEWGEIVHDVLLPERLTLTITAISETERRLSFVFPKQLAYLIPGGSLK